MYSWYPIVYISESIHSLNNAVAGLHHRGQGPFQIAVLGGVHQEIGDPEANVFLERQGRPQVVPQKSGELYMYDICIYVYPGLNFTYGVETLILYQSLKIPNLSHYKMMVLNLQRITENDNMILLQN